MARLRLPVIALTLLTSTNAWADLKTYDVDPQYQQEIFTALRSVLEPQGLLPAGRVQLLPSGQILVNADADTLKQVEQVMQAVRTKSVAATPRVALRYWGVFAALTKSPDANRIGSAEVLGFARALAFVEEGDNFRRCLRCENFGSNAENRVHEVPGCEMRRSLQR